MEVRNCFSSLSSSYPHPHPKLNRRRLQGLPAPRRRRRRRQLLRAAVHLPDRRRASPPAAAAAAKTAAAARPPTVAATAARLTAVHGLVACRGRATGRHSAVRGVRRRSACRILRLSAIRAARGEGKHVNEGLKGCVRWGSCTCARKSNFTYSSTVHVGATQTITVVVTARAMKAVSSSGRKACNRLCNSSAT